MKREKNVSNWFTTEKLVKVSIIGSIAFIIMLFEFPIAILFPAFLQIDFSDVVVFIGGVILGPIYVVIGEFVKNLLHLFLKGTTGGIGELSNFVTGVSLIYPAVLIYKRKSFKKLILGLAVGTITATIVMSVMNYFVFLPLYGMSNSDLFSSIVYTFAPFNFVKGVILSVAIVILDKAFSPYYNHL